MRLYNTLTKTIEEFIPNEPGKVKMYTCGPTVYHFAHIGNLRTYLMEDVLEKFLRYAGYEVTRVMNVTDVGHLTSDGDTGEDKMLKGAKREHKTVLEIADFYEKAFFKVVGFGIIDFDYIALHIVKGLAVADDLFRLYAPAHLIISKHKM